MSDKRRGKFKPKKKDASLPIDFENSHNSPPSAISSVKAQRRPSKKGATSMTHLPMDMIADESDTQLIFEQLKQRYEQIDKYEMAQKIVSTHYISSASMTFDRSKLPSSSLKISASTHSSPEPIESGRDSIPDSATFYEGIPISNSNDYEASVSNTTTASRTSRWTLQNSGMSVNQTSQTALSEPQNELEWATSDSVASANTYRIAKPEMTGFLFETIVRESQDLADEPSDDRSPPSKPRKSCGTVSSQPNSSPTNQPRRSRRLSGMSEY